MSRARSLASIFVFVLALAIAPWLVGCATGGGYDARETAPTAAEPIAAAAPAAAVAAVPPTSYEPCKILDPPCSKLPGGCKNTPYFPTDCLTTQYGAAAADVVIEATNLLYCNGGNYALCFASGPPYATGNPNSGNQPLPCELGDDPSVANCKCEVYTTGAWFVDINSILNRGAYYQAVEECGQDGHECQNLRDCGKDGTGSKCAGLKVPSVCSYVQNQAPNDISVSLLPKADLVSTFSFAMNDTYEMGKGTDCTQVPNPLYAGCMTAPCFYPPGAPMPPKDGDPVYCQCPTWQGPYQVGQPDQSCTIPDGPDGTRYVWSASYHVGGGLPSSGN